MFKGLRVPEQVFTVIMWIVSLVFAAFLIGFGRLVIGDLPSVTSPVNLEDFMDRATAQKLEAEQVAIGAKRRSIDKKSEDADLVLESARKDYTAAREAYDTWVSTRRATTDPAQDPEVISRTRGLDGLNAKVRAVEQTRETLAAEKLTAERVQSDINQRMQDLRGQAAAPYAKAQFRQEMNVFGLRLLITLPLLVIAGWLINKKRKSDYWPLMRGFVLFAAFAFFVELVPYLPSYGGYVRYIVGIVLTAIASHYVIKWMRHYLANRVVSEQKAEVERKQSIKYEDALKKMSANVCPGCERPTASTGDVQADFCVHCGMQLFDHCKKCDSRKLAFFRYCMKCGTTAASETASGFVATGQAAPNTPV